MEESFKAREAELECNMQQKKRFLWGLARALRKQHSNMADAMRAVQKESERLTAKVFIYLLKLNGWWQTKVTYALYFVSFEFKLSTFRRFYIVHSEGTEGYHYHVQNLKLSPV